VKIKDKNIVTLVLNQKIYLFVNGKIVKVRSVEPDKQRFFK
jgi:hypothetical protein